MNPTESPGPSPFRIAFFGSGPFAVPLLERLARIVDEEAHLELVAIVSRPGRPSGRGRKIRPQPVETRAGELGLEVRTPESINDPAELARLESLAPDLFLVADYGEFLRRPFRELARLGAFNFHGSILPRHRGAAPVARALLAGDPESGVTLFRIVQEMDAGPVVSIVRTPVQPSETAGELEARLAVLAADQLEATLPTFVDGTFTETPQDDELATKAPKLSPAEAGIPWSSTAGEVAARIHALHPWPVARSDIERPGLEPAVETLRLLRALPLADRDPPSTSEPGVVLEVTPEGIDVATSGGTVRLLELQRPGKKGLSARDFVRGFPVRPGDRFV